MDVTSTALERRVHLTRRVTRQLDRERSRLDCEWWETDTAALIGDLARNGPFLMALAGLARAIRATDDPLWVVGGTSPTEAHAVAWEWLESGVDPADVGDWLLAGCWDPRAAWRLAHAGISPTDLLDEDQQPDVWIEGLDGERIPLALAVADHHISATIAATLTHP